MAVIASWCEQIKSLVIRLQNSLVPTYETIDHIHTVDDLLNGSRQTYPVDTETKYTDSTGNSLVIQTATTCRRRR